MSSTLEIMGAARQVTGSMFLLEHDDYRLLIDCGLDLEAERKQRDGLRVDKIFSFEPSSINAVLLTHAHIDHSGNIPNLYKDGFEGQVLCSLPTYELSALLLMDSARLNQAKLRKKKSQKKHSGRINKGNLYVEHHVREALEYFNPVAFNKWFKISDEIRIKLNPCSHLLGAANVVIEFGKGDDKKTIAFSGDIGRQNYPLLKDPVPLPPVDYLVTESTYGGRYHKEKRSPEEVVLETIQAACVDQPGKLIIPAFAVGRTQALLFTLYKLHLEGRLPAIPIFVDSPLAIASTKVHQKMYRFLSDDAREMFSKGDDLFDFENMHFIKRNKSNDAYDDHHQSSILISSSGMMEGGRIQYHIRKNIENHHATIFMIGFAAEGTLARRLADGLDVINMRGKEFQVNAKILQTDVFSGHGDQQDLMDFVGSQHPAAINKIFLVHGEEESMELFRVNLEEKGYDQVVIPRKLQRFEL